MKNFVQSSSALRVTAPYDVEPGDPMVGSGFFGVAQDKAASGSDLVMAREGVFALKKASEAITKGDLLYFNPSSKVITKTSATGNLKVGKATASALLADATVETCLVPNLEAAVS